MQLCKTNKITLKYSCPKHLESRLAGQVAKLVATQNIRDDSQEQGVKTRLLFLAHQKPKK